jgi:hypothetical protein
MSSFIGIQHVPHHDRHAGQTGNWDRWAGKIQAILMCKMFDKGPRSLRSLLSIWVWPGRERRKTETRRYARWGHQRQHRCGSEQMISASLGFAWDFQRGFQSPSLRLVGLTCLTKVSLKHISIYFRSFRTGSFQQAPRCSDNPQALVWLCFVHNVATNVSWSWRSPSPLSAGN